MSDDNGDGDDLPGEVLFALLLIFFALAVSAWLIREYGVLGP